MDDLLPDRESVISAALRGIPPADTDASLILLFAALQALREAELPDAAFVRAQGVVNTAQGRTQAAPQHIRQSTRQNISPPQASQPPHSQPLPPEKNTAQVNGLRAASTAQPSPPRGNKRRASSSHQAA